MLKCVMKGVFSVKKIPVRGAEISDVFRRAGTLAAALITKVADTNEEVEKDTLSIYAEASNGQMPNLDLINVVNYLAVHVQGLHVKVEKLWYLIDSKWLKVIDETFESLGKVARSLNPQRKFGIPIADYIEGIATLASSIYHQALGVPAGPHGPFHDYQVDAITWEISPKVSSNNKGRRNEFLLRGGRLVEGVYMIAFALLVAPLLMVAASLYSDANKQDFSLDKDKLTSSSATIDVPAITSKLWKWLHAAKTVFVVHLWRTIITLLPYFIRATPITLFIFH